MVWAFISAYINEPNYLLPRFDFIYGHRFIKQGKLFDLVHAVDDILIPLKQLRASQNRLRNMSDGRENAICSCICIYNISEEKNQMLLAVYTGYVLPPHRSIGLII